MTDSDSSDTSDSSSSSTQLPPANALVVHDSQPPLVINPYQPAEAVSDLVSPNDSAIGDPAMSPAAVPSDVKPPVWPSFVAGTLFGFAHFDYGLSFIPLSVLGVVLGLLYRAKHSIWPCFVLHFALNAFAMASLGIALLVEAAK